MATSLHAGRGLELVRFTWLRHVLASALQWPARALARQRAEQAEAATLRSMSHSERRDLDAAAARQGWPPFDRG